MKNLFVLIAIFTALTSFGQGFIEGIEADDIGLILGRPCVVSLASGEEVTGKISSAGLVSGYLNKITLKKEDGEKLKLKPEDITRLIVKASKLAKLAMVAQSTSSIKEITSTNFEEIVNREYFIFETAMRSNKKGNLRLMQLLNPGFDSQIKVFADPNAQETGGLKLGGLKIAGGEDKSYLFVVNDEKTVRVKKGSYKKNFEELYLNCPRMIEVFEGEKIKWDDVAGHVFVYDQTCK